MINRIIDFSIKHKMLIGIFILIWVVLGFYSVNQVPIDATPDITNNQVQVITESPNLSTEDVEQFVTYPIELAMSNLPDVEEVRSISRFGLSVVTIVFKDELGTYLPRQLVSEKLELVREEIPEGFGNPNLSPISTGLGEIYQYTLAVDESFKDEYTLTDLRVVQDWIISRQLALVPGVVEVNAFGGKEKQFEVAVHPRRLKALDLTIADVFRSLKSNNQNAGGAYIEKNHQANFIRAKGLAKNVKDIEQILITTKSGVPVRVKDVAKVKIGHNLRYGALTKNGKGETVGGMILMLKGANSNEVIQNVKERMVQIEKSLPEGIKIEPYLDRSNLIERTTSTVKNNLLEGGLIVIFILVLVLGNWRGGLIVASTIPLSLLFAFILMHYFGVWANLMSLGAIDFGIIVDGAVIIVESSVFYLSAYLLKHKKITQSNKEKLISNSSKKMMNAAFFGQLIIIIVFIPILSLEGVEGKMFKPMALTFIFAMLGAMILCLTYVPMMTALFLKAKPAKEKRFKKINQGIKKLESAYTKALSKSLNWGRWFVGSAVILLVLATYTFMQIGAEFIPQLDEGDIAFHTILKPGSSLSETVATTTQVEKIILDKYPEVKSVISRIGVAEVATDPMPMDIADTFIIFHNDLEWTTVPNKKAFIAAVKEDLNQLPGISYEFTQPIEMRFNELLTGVREDVAIKIFGEDLDILALKADEINELIKNVPGIAEAKVEATTGLPQITIDYKRNKLAQYGLSIEQVNDLITTSFSGKKAGVIFEGIKKFDLVVRLPENQRANAESLENLFIKLPTGNQIPLREVAAVKFETGPMQISRDNTNRRTYVGINIRDRDVASVVQDIQQILDKNLVLPPGYYLEYGGAFENLERATKKLKTLVPLALLLIFILIYFALKSVKQTLIIYMAIPLAAIGGVFALVLRGMPFSISAGIGFIVLFGVAVLNGLVLISSFNALRQNKELPLRERILTGTKQRLRPILLTALTDILGFLPMALSTSAGAEVQRPLATVVIGGLITATLLTLFILPILYQWIETRKHKNTSKKWAFATITLLLVSLPTQAQSIENLPALSLKAAIDTAVTNFPQIKNDLLTVEQSLQAKTEAYNWGNTQIFTGAEELKDGRGVYNLIGISQNNIELLGIGRKTAWARAKLEQAEGLKKLSYENLKKTVSIKWTEALIAKKTLDVYLALDSIYQEFERAINMQYEVEAISTMQRDAARNLILQKNIALRQAKSNAETKLLSLNLFLFTDTIYDVKDQINTIDKWSTKNFEEKEHPEFILSQKNAALAQAVWQKEKSKRLPSFNLEYVFQEVNNQKGFAAYQIGLNIPILDGTLKSRINKAKLAYQKQKNNLDFKKRELDLKFKIAYNNYLQTKSNWESYQKTGLNLIKKQKEGALFAFKEGAINYIEFTQLVKQAIETELDALQSLQAYLMAVHNLNYYNPN